MSINQNREKYNFVEITINKSKKVYYKLIKIIINIFRLVNIIIDIKVQYYIFLNFIVIDYRLIFILKF